MKEKMTAIIKAQFKGADVIFEDVTKNNGVVLHGVSIRENGDSIAPCIYYDADSVTEENVEEVTQEIIKQYNKHKENSLIELVGASDFIKKHMNVDYVSENVFPFVLDYEKNKEMIESNGLVFRKVLDLAVLYRIKVCTDDNGMASFKVSYKHLDVINITPKELDLYAFQNAERDLEVSSMRDIIINDIKSKCGDFEPDEMFDAMFGPDEGLMTIYSNNSRYFGAVSMLIPHVFKEKCYILPSSIHEVIVIPASGNEADAESFKNMVMEVNSTQVSPEERLSYSIYYYNGESLEIVA